MTDYPSSELISSRLITTWKPACIERRLAEGYFYITRFTSISDTNDHLGSSHKWAYKKGYSTAQAITGQNDWRLATSDWSQTSSRSRVRWFPEGFRFHFPFRPAEQASGSWHCLWSLVLDKELSHEPHPPLLWMVTCHPHHLLNLACLKGFTLFCYDLPDIGWNEIPLRFNQSEALPKSG